MNDKTINEEYIKQLKEIKSQIKENKDTGIYEFNKFVEQFEYDNINRNFGFPIDINHLVKLSDGTINYIVEVKNEEYSIDITFLYTYQDWDYENESNGFLQIIKHSLHNDSDIQYTVRFETDERMELEDGDISEIMKEYVQDQSNVVTKRKEKLKKLENE
jgi:hypothetical protein